MGKRVNLAVWLEKYNRWQIKVQKDGVRKTFTSSLPGRAGMRECHSKADAFLDDNIEDNIKLGKLAQMWLEEIKNNSGTGNYENAKGCLNNWILPTLEHRKINTISEQDFQKILNSAHKKGRAYKTINNIRAYILLFLKYARKCNVSALHLESLYIPKNAIKNKKGILQPKDLKTLFSIDTQTVYEKQQKVWYINAFRFLAATGLRRGELVALQTKRDYEESTNTLYVRQSVNKFNELTEGKTKNAQRSFFYMI